MTDVGKTDPVIGSDGSKRLAGRASSANLADFRIRQFCKAIRIAARVPSLKNIKPMARVLAFRDPFQVFGTIVFTVSVYVVYLMGRSWFRAKKCLSHKPMN